MKKYLKYIFAASLCLINSLTSAQSMENNALSLKDIIKLTIGNHPLIKQKEAELHAAQFRVDQQKSFYLPDVTAEAVYTRIGPIPAFALGGENLELAPANNYNVGVFVHQTLYDFDKRDSQVEYAKSFLSSIKNNEDLIKNDLANQAVRVFYGILFLQKSIAVKDTQYVALQEHLKVTELRIKNGTATDYDELSTKTRMVEIKNEKIDLQNEKNKQELYLKELIGMDRSKEILISGYLDLPKYILNDDSLLTAAYSQRVELKLASSERNTANLQKEMVSQTDKPVVKADLGYGFKNGFEPNIEVMRGNWFAGVSLNVPIFNGNLTENKINEADAAIDAVDQKIKQVKESISTDVYQSESDLKSNVERMNSTQEQINYARSSLERAKLQYEKGAGTNLEVLDSETALTQARLLNIQAEYKSIISYYSLHRAIGDLRTITSL
ncbi:MAG: TolC family protein [Ignavibacteriales bacterium]|nr:TolC family protein [Ignavibacteriales bacterium]